MDPTAAQLTFAELYEITTTDGSVLRVTSHDASIVYGGNTYQALPIKRSQIAYHTDLQVDKVEISMGLVGVKVGAKEYSIPKLIRLGLLRNAHVKIHLIDYVLKNEIKLLFEGWVTEGISYNNGIVTLSVGSILDKLNEKFPKYIYSEYCNHQLYSLYCGLTKNNYKISSTAGAGSTESKIYSSVFAFSAHAEGYWAKGELKMTAGGNANLSRTIIKHNDGNVELLIPFPEAVVVGDAFDAWPGCDKAGVTCHEKFNNYANFLGFEYTPKPEVLLP